MTPLPLSEGMLGRRFAQLLAGLALYGLSLAMIIRSSLGNAPWDVLHQGMARIWPISIGAAVIVMSVVVLAAWVPLRERPGAGTVANAILVGLAADAGLALIVQPVGTGPRAALLAAGIALNALATALYLGARLGAGPRDGLMTGLHRRTGLPLGLVRLGLEVGVVGAGFALGGTVGLGTVLYAVAIGPLVQVLLPAVLVPGRDERGGVRGDHDLHRGEAGISEPCLP